MRRSDYYPKKKSSQDEGKPLKTLLNVQKERKLKDKLP